MKARITKRVAQVDQRQSIATCKSCMLCRQKKTKCDGTKPECRNCTSAGHSCTYPQDARRDLRPSRSRLHALEDSLASLWQELNASRSANATQMPSPVLTNTSNIVEPRMKDDEAEHKPKNPTWHDVEGKELADETMSSPSTKGNPHDHNNSLARNPAQNTGQEDESSLPDRLFPIAVPERDDDTMSLHPCEGRVAGVSEDNGKIRVHGPSSILNGLTPPRTPGAPGGSSQRYGTPREATMATKSRLIGNTAVQRQMEVQIYAQPSDKLDLDGVAPQLARHLLDVHWNGPHYTYMVTYRPAIMHSLLMDGPWVNKLLLHAIFFSSSLVSDWAGSRAECGNFPVAGRHFYDRFRQLLVDEIVRPSLPSAVALILVSSTLVSQGQASAGWTLSGTAFRMLTDLGCHLVQDPNQRPAASHSELVHEDVELEVRKRLYWGAFMTDAALSLFLGRPSSLCLTESRVPQMLLDTYEELEPWSPYVEPSNLECSLRNYAPRPAYAVSTFKAMCSLFTISSRMNKELYSIESIKYGPQHLKDIRDHLVQDLTSWSESLPSHLQFDPDTDSSPPPHQIALHTTFHTINILVQRAFMRDGHLRRRTNNAEKMKSEEICIHHALKIYKYVEAYRLAFTLRQAPFLISYAVYSAAVVMLCQQQRDRSEFQSAIAFFWKALSELQRGCNVGLKKPLAVLRGLIQEVGETDVADQELAPTDPATLEPANMAQFCSSIRGNMGEVSTALPVPRETLTTTPAWPAFAAEFDPCFGNSDDSFLGFLDDQEATISNDILYGLFAPH